MSGHPLIVGERASRQRNLHEQGNKRQRNVIEICIVGNSKGLSIMESGEV